MTNGAAPPDNDVLFTRALSLRADGIAVLSAVTLGVRTGELLAVTGAGGSGKSGLLRCLAGQIRPASGELWFNSMPLHAMSGAKLERVRRERFGWIGSVPELLPELTVWENVALPLLLSGLGRRAARASAVGWLERLDIGPFADRLPTELDLVQRQRVALARALAHEPTILFADEPTTRLPRREGGQLLRTLTTAARSHGITVVLATGEEPVPPTPDSAYQPPEVRGTSLMDRTVRLVGARRVADRPATATEELDSPSCTLSV